ncbi:MAG: hypothetical protein RLZZ603_582 [Actinomycetota bacterium]|jgi:Zn-dependent protease with chaperone function
MLAYGGLLALSLSWFLLSGLFGPKFLNVITRRLPSSVSLWLWLSGLYALLFSAITAAVSLGLLIGYGWSTSSQADRGVGDLWYLFLVSVLPYVALALLGALAAAVFTRLQPALSAARSTNALLRGSSSEIRNFNGVPIRVLETNVLAAAIVEVARQPIILITRGVLETLSADELEAVYWHELGHAFGEHNGLSRIALFASTLTPWLPFTREAQWAIGDLCERSADGFAASRVDSKVLQSARQKFSF